MGFSMEKENTLIRTGQQNIGSVYIYSIHLTAMLCRGYYSGEFKSFRTPKLEGMSKLPLCNGKRNGYGVRVFVSGARYEGTWLDDCMHGEGYIKTDTGGKFEGQFFNNLRSSTRLYPCIDS